MLELIGAGYGRTGTTSLMVALNELGYPTYHMKVLLKRWEEDKIWLRIDKGTHLKEDFDKIFGGGEWRAVTDWPACKYYKELMELYPNAKLLLTVRDADKWYDSVVNTVYKFTDPGMPLFIKPFVPRMWSHEHLAQKLFWKGTFNNRMHDREYVQKVYLDHIEEVKRTVPADRLLVFHISEGWDPLCKFLGVPVPNKPFPHVNDTASFNNMVMGIQESNKGKVLFRQAVTAAVLAAASAAAWTLKKAAVSRK